MSNQIQNCSYCGISDTATQYVNGGSHEAQDSKWISGHAWYAEIFHEH